jgi:hypothetical protein
MQVWLVEFVPPPPGLAIRENADACVRDWADANLTNRRPLMTLVPGFIRFVPRRVRWPTWTLPAPAPNGHDRSNQTSGRWPPKAPVHTHREDHEDRCRG